MGQAESRQEQFWEACGFGHVDKVRELLEEGVDVNWVSKTHDSCPIHAASQGKPEIVKMLIEAGCDVNVRDERKSTALHHAAMNGYTDCVKLLIEAGACVNVEDKNSWTPLHNAAYWAHSEVTEILISHKADCTIKNKDARLPLHEVARSRSTDEKSIERITELLIERGCDIESKAGTDGFSDFTALMFASYHGHVSVVQQLLKANCNVNAQSYNKWTALHWASDRSHADVVELLLKNDAEVNIQGNRSELAIDRAKNEEVKALFIKLANQSLPIKSSPLNNSKPEEVAEVGPLPDEMQSSMRKDVDLLNDTSSTETHSADSSDKELLNEHPLANPNTPNN